jgi:squalene-associated FAD-dependent desaturase
MDGDGARHVVIVGGGLAGLAAACDLSDQGVKVTLLERRPYLGGKVYSFMDDDVGPVDNGQHIFLRCCTAYIAFLKRLGVLDRTTLQPTLNIPVIGKDGRTSFLRRSPLTPPFHLALSIARYRHLSFMEKLSALKPVLAMRNMRYAELVGLDDIDFATWLKQHGQDDAAIAHLWDLIVLPAMNDASSRVSAEQAIMVFQEAFLGEGDAADVGLAQVDLSSLCYREASAYIEGHGGRVLLGANAGYLEGGTQGIGAVHTHGGEVIQGDAYIAAVPPQDLLSLLSKEVALDPFFSPAARLKTSPIVNLHLWFDAPVTNLQFAAYLDSYIQWVFAKPASTIGMDGPEQGRSETHHMAARGQHIVVSLSGAHRYINMPKEDLYALLLLDLQERIPAARAAHVVHHVIVQERDATFTPEPGSAAWRLPSRTPIHNLYLAGAWTDTGWPATMEGAVRSGTFAAREVLRHAWHTP